MSAFKTNWKLSESNIGVKSAGDAHAICTVSREISPVRREDIARLIAHAPELFRALDTLSYNVLSSHPSELFCIDDMMNVVAIGAGGRQIDTWEMARIARQLLHEASPETHEAPCEDEVDLSW